MTQSQQDRIQVTDVSVARALRQHHGFLVQFLDPRSPTDVAPRLGMAPNLVHHHARKLTELGLLFESGREGGKVFYQLAARELRVPSDLLPPGDREGNGTADVRNLSVGFLRAYERSWSQMHAGEEDVYGFGDAERPSLVPPLPDAPSTETHPTHLDALTLRLTPERYTRLVRALSALLTEAAAEGIRKDGPPCTVAVLAFRGVPEGEPEDFRGIGRRVNSFLGGED